MHRNKALTVLVRKIHEFIHLLNQKLFLTNLEIYLNYINELEFAFTSKTSPEFTRIDEEGPDNIQF